MSTVVSQTPASRLFIQPFIKKTPKLHVTGLCEGNSPGTGEFPALRASNAEMFPVDDVIMNSFFLSSGLYM